MRAVAELPEEFAGPVGYADRWLWIAVALLGLVVVYYAVAWWSTRPPRRRPAPITAPPDVRREHLARIDQVEEQVRSGAISARVGHQQLSRVVRGYVAAVSPLPAPTMTLADLRALAPAALTDVIELVYPPEFAPDEAHARDAFDVAVRRARTFVAHGSAR